MWSKIIYIILAVIKFPFAVIEAGARAEDMRPPVRTNTQTIIAMVNDVARTLPYHVLDIWRTVHTLEPHVTPHKMALIVPAIYSFCADRGEPAAGASIIVWGLLSLHNGARPTTINQWYLVYKWLEKYPDLGPDKW